MVRNRESAIVSDKTKYDQQFEKAVKKPLTLLVVLACAAYAVFLAVMLAELAVQMKFDSAKGMVIILTVWSLYLFC